MRTNLHGTLDRVELPAEPTPEGAPRREAVFSIVSTGDARRRGIPRLYLDTLPVYGDRDIGRVVERLSSVATAVIASRSTPTYLSEPCRVADRTGLYVRDTFNRSSYRLRLARSGVEFADEQFIELGPDGRFHSGRWGSLDVGFLVIAAGEEGEPDVVTAKAGLSTFTLVALRLGSLPRQELGILTKALAGSVAIGARHPTQLVSAVEELDADITRDAPGSAGHVLCDPE